MAPPLCKFWARGDCRNGDHCKFDHPRDLPRNENRFASLQTNNSSHRNHHGRANNDGRETPPRNNTYSLNREVIISDLSTERPQWILSAYGPAPKAPAQLFGGPVREQSFEEMRLRHYEGVAAGNPALMIQQADALIQEAEAQMRNALNDIDGAIEFIRTAENDHPNRIDICRISVEGKANTIHTSSNTFDPSRNTSAPLVQTFDQIPVLSAWPNPFGAPSQKFGQPSQPGSAGSFGQPSVLGQKVNPFGQPSGGSTLVKGPNVAPGPFSSFARITNPFGAPLAPTDTTPFAKVVKKGFPDAIEQPSRAADIRSETHPTHPGQHNAQTPSSLFSIPSTSFGVPQPPARTNPLSNFAQPPLTDTVLQGTKDTVAETSFNPSSTAGSNGQIPSRPVGPSYEERTKTNGVESTGPYKPNSQFQHPNFQSYASKGADQKLTMFKGRQVIYSGGEAGFRNGDGSWEKIWFPNGPPAYYGATEMDDSLYKEDTKTSYLHLRNTGSFKDGIMPVLPPKREWCLWDF